MRLERTVYATHKWLGLLSGPFLIVIGLTGSCVAFHDELVSLQFPQLVRVDANVNAHRVPLESLFEAARSARPDVWVYGVRFFDDPGASSRVLWFKEGQYGELAADPYTGRILGEMDRSRSVARVLLSLHYTLLLPPWGDLVVGLVGFAFIASGVSGAWVYRRSLARPLRRGLRLRHGVRRLSKDLHTLVGVASIAFNLVLAASGAYMMLYAFSLDYLSGARESQAAAASPPKVALGPDAFLNAAVRALPGLSPTSVFLPVRPGEPASVYGNMAGTPFWLGGDRGWGRSYVELDAQTGRVLKTVDVRRADLATRWETALWELHFGQYGGLPVKILYAAVGLTPGLLSVSGFILWWKRRVAARARAAPTGRLASLAGLS